MELITEVCELMWVIDDMKIPWILEKERYENFCFIEDLFIDFMEERTHERESEAYSELFENGTTGQGK